LKVKRESGLAELADRFFIEKSFAHEYLEETADEMNDGEYAS